MSGKSVGLTIVLWVETIISIRVLLFSIPVVISKYMAKSFALADLNDRFIAVMSVVALLYVLTGIISILGIRGFKAVHFGAAILTLAVTVGSLYAFDQPNVTVGLNYFYPVIFAVVFTALVGFSGKK